MAIPPSAVTKIAFTPPLPYPKRQAFDNTVEGKLSTFVVTYDDDFWTQRECTGDVYVLNGHTSNRPLLCCFDISTEDSPALTGYCIRNGGNTKSAILQQLSQYFGDEALHPLKCTVRHWYGGSPMCCYKSFEDLCEAQRKTDRIFWAGAETSIEWFGTMSGAVLAANRAAREVIYDLRPALLSVDDMAVFA
jgi:monoamine oxidase